MRFAVRNNGTVIFTFHLCSMYSSVAPDTFCLQGFERELAKRTSNMSSIRVAAHQLMDKSASSASPADESFVQGRLVDLTTKWDKVCRLSGRKQERLQDACALVS